MKRKIYLKSLLIVLLSFGILSCSDDDNTINNENEGVIKLKADKESITPFEKITISIDHEIESLFDSYDSLQWICNGTWWNGTITIPPIEKDVRDLDITDYRIGKNEISILGYKKGVFKGKGSLEFQVVKPTNDFFTINWGKKNPSNYYIALNPVIKTPNHYLYKGIMINVYHNYDLPESEYAKLDITPHSASISIGNNMSSGLKAIKATNSNDYTLPDIDNFQFGQDSETREKAHLITYEFFDKFMTLTYGESVYKLGENITAEKLLDEYNKRFKYELYECQPVEIWETLGSYICLLSRDNNSRHYVIAEPRY